MEYEMQWVAVKRGDGRDRWELVEFRVCLETQCDDQTLELACLLGFGVVSLWNRTRVFAGVEGV